jgi:hypothetical protein
MASVRPIKATANNKKAGALAILVGLLLRCFGDRLAPRWRFLLWGVVLARLADAPLDREQIEQVRQLLAQKQTSREKRS